MKLVVSGSRRVERDSFQHRLLWRILDTVRYTFYDRMLPSEVLEVVQGQSPGGGVDLYTAEWAAEVDGMWGTRVVSIPVPILPGEHPMDRNTRMIVVHQDADVFLALNYGRTNGTADALRKMRNVAHNLEVAGQPAPTIIEVNLS